MLSMLIAYDSTGNVVATQDHMVSRDESGEVTGLIDFAAHEVAGGKLRDIWFVEKTGDGLAGLPLAYQCSGGPDVGHPDQANILDDCPGGEWRQPALGSGTWPEWIGGRAHDFRVELDGKRIKALVHKVSGHRRERAGIEAAIEATPRNEKGERDIRHVVGGPSRPLVLDAEGRTVGRSKDGGSPKHLPLVGVR